MLFRCAEIWGEFFSHLQEDGICNQEVAQNPKAKIPVPAKSMLHL